METNRQLLKIGTFIVLAVLLLCIAISLYATLAEPVFFFNSLECQSGSSRGYSKEDCFYFQIQYITNVSDSRIVEKIEFPELPDLSPYVYDVDLSPPRYSAGLGTIFAGNTSTSPPVYGRYSIRSLAVTIDDSEEILKPLSLTEAEVYFSNGDIQTVDLGKIVLVSREHESLLSKSSSSSSGGWSGKNYRVMEDVTLIRVEPPIPEQFQDRFSLEINGINYTEISGFQFKKGSEMEAVIRYNTAPSPLAYDQYMPHPTLYYEDDDGNVHAVKLGRTVYDPYSIHYSFIGLLSYLHSREVL